MPAPPRPTGELKQVTALFCDLVNSTALTERLGAERMHDLVRAFIDRALEEVHLYGGTAPQFLGDGFMALFGAPVAHEDHVRRALLAALAIQQTVGEEIGGATGSGRPEVAVRIGIDTGLVVFGNVGDRLATAPTAIGDTANLAARLQEAAEPGTILISDATRRLAQDFARVAPAGPFQLKGKTEPVRAYRLVGCSYRRTALEAASRIRDFVDRDRELATLDDLARHVEAGRGRAVSLVGEPGIGKSRLLAEFRRHLPGMNWIEGRCLSYGTATPYLPVLDLLRGQCGIDEADGPAVVTDKIRSGLERVGMDPDADGVYLLHLLGLHDLAGSAGGSSPEAQKAKTFEILRRLAVEGSRRQPLAIVVEDLHWLDRVSEEFFTSLIETVPEAGILAVATYRPEYRPPWSDAPYAAKIALQPLSHNDSLQVVRSVLGSGQDAEPLTPQIVAKGDGNPFFLEQLALHAVEDGRPQSAATVPNTIHDVVMARIDRLPEATKRLLQIAAVLGREFSFRLLEAVWPGPGAIEPHLRELSRLEFIDKQPDRERLTYVFHHALTQETAYASLLERDRRLWHARIGRAIEVLYEGNAEEVAERLALHFGRSDEAEKAVDYAILAAEKSQRRWANGGALAFFDDALRRLDAMPDSEANRLRRIDAVLKQAEVKFALGQHAEHIEALEKVRGIVEQSDDPRRRATWHYWFGFLHSLTGSPTAVAVAHCGNAAAIASAAGFAELDGYIQSSLAQAYVAAGQLHPAIEAGERALAVFEAQGNLWWAGRTLWHLASAALYQGEWQQSLDYCRRGLAYGAALDDLRLRVAGLYRTGSAYIQQGDCERGLRYCDEALALEPSAYDVAFAKSIRGYGLVKVGRIDAGVAELTEAIEWLDSSHLRFVRSAPALRLAEAYLRRGEPDKARGLIDGVLTASHATGYRYIEGLAHRLLAECLTAEAPTAGERHVDQALRIFDAIGARNDLAKALATRAALRQATGDLVQARSLWQQAGAIFDALGTCDEPARVEAALAALGRKI